MKFDSIAVRDLLMGAARDVANEAPEPEELLTGSKGGPAGLRAFEDFLQKLMDLIPPRSRVDDWMLGWWLKNADGGGFLLQIRPFMVDVIRMLVREKDKKDYADKVVAFLSGEGVSAQTTAALYGVKVNSPIALRADLHLIPIEEAPDHLVKYQVLPLVIPIGAPPPPQPTAAVVMTYPHKDYLSAGPSETLSAKPFEPANVEIRRTIDATVSALALLNGCAPVVAARWTTYVVPFKQLSGFIQPELLAIPGATPKYNLLGGIPLQMPLTWQGVGETQLPPISASFFGAKPVDADLAIDAVDLYLKAPEAIKSATKVALERLVKAKWARRAVDRAVELGICLESLLLHKVSSTNELSFRFALWGASILGSITDDRMQILRQLRDIYNLRSKAVHTGELPNLSKAQEELLETGVGYAEKIALEYLRQTWPMEFDPKRVWDSGAERPSR